MIYACKILRKTLPSVLVKKILSLADIKLRCQLGEPYLLPADKFALAGYRYARGLPTNATLEEIAIGYVQLEYDIPDHWSIISLRLCQLCCQYDLIIPFIHFSSRFGTVLPWLSAIEYSATKIFRHLLGNDGGFVPTYKYLFRICCRSGNIEMVETLVSKQMPSRGLMLDSIAISKGEVTKYLCELANKNQNI